MKWPLPKDWIDPIPYNKLTEPTLDLRRLRTAAMRCAIEATHKTNTMLVVAPIIPLATEATERSQLQKLLLIVPALMVAILQETQIVIVVAIAQLMATIDQGRIRVLRTDNAFLLSVFPGGW